MPSGEIQKLIITEEVIRIKSYFPLKISLFCVYIKWGGKKRTELNSSAKHNFYDDLQKWMYIQPLAFKYCQFVCIKNEREQKHLFFMNNFGK